jgi:hypothetical protein
MVETAVFLGLRVFTGLVSFALFALITRWLVPADAKGLVYFLFIAGFFMSALRLLCSQAAALHGPERRADKLRRALRAWALVACAALLLLPLALWVLAGPTPALWGLPLVAVVIVLWGLDLDLLRAAVGRRSLVAPAAAVGAVGAIVCLAVFRTPEGALGALLLQWLPLVVMQAALAWRLRRRLRRALGTVWRSRGQGLPSLMAMALFDGLVINAPFFLDARTPAEVGVSIGVVTRIFVSSLMLMPLVMFWSNGRLLSQVGRRLGLSPAWVFWALALGSGTAAGLALAACFTWLAGQPPQPVELLAALALLLGYCSFATVSRYHGAAGAGAGGRAAWPLLLALALANLLAVAWALATPQPALATAVVQMAALLLAAALLALWPCRQALPREVS